MTAAGHIFARTGGRRYMSTTRKRVGLNFRWPSVCRPTRLRVVLVFPAFGCLQAWAQQCGWLALVLTLGLAGCANLAKEPAPASSSAAADGNGNPQRTLVDFERKRDEADYQIALARWSADDMAGCESTLLELLRRNPDHREGRLLLADLYVSTNKPAAAEKHLRLLLENDADDARAHHALGLLLETNAKAKEALSHFQRAHELEPANGLYAASHSAAQSTLEPVATKPGRKVAFATLAGNGAPSASNGPAPRRP